MSNKQQNRGFTLIELVVVIAILAILAAFALPRFALLSEEAHVSSIKATSGALSAGVALAKAQWLTNGSTVAVDNVAGFGNGIINVSSRGWAVASTGTYTGEADGSAVMTADRCVQVWEELLQSNAPTIAASGTATDYTASAATSVCTFAYNLNGGSDNIQYDASTGEISVNIN